MSEPLFPIQNGPAIPWRLITPHELQAITNHDQTLKRLAERGGLACCEAVAILEDRPWRRMPVDESREALIKIINEDFGKDLAKLREENLKLQKEIESLRRQVSLG